MTTFDADGITLEKVRDYVWEIPQEGGMNAPARVLASEALLEEIQQDKTLQQLKNSAHLPGVRKHAICMPDGHQGYGFPVGGVAGIDAEDGCISPGARSEEHTSELQSHAPISYAVFCLKKKK